MSVRCVSSSIPACIRCAGAGRRRSLCDAFHVEVLKDGAVPLQVLEAKIQRWIEAQRTPAEAEI